MTLVGARVSQKMKHPHLASQREASIFSLSGSQVRSGVDTTFSSPGCSQPTCSRERSWQTWESGSETVPKVGESV